DGRQGQDRQGRQGRQGQDRQGRQEMTRRALAGAAVATVANAAAAAAQVRQPTAPSRPLPVPKAELTLARRVTYGLTPDDVSQVFGYGFAGYLNWQLAPATIDDAGCDARLAPYTTLGMPTAQLYALDSNVVTREVIESSILRSIYSRRQLFERMVEFWSDHLNTNINTVGIYKTAEYRDVTRK